ncbi:MAG: aspartate aminotransferase family protein [Pseudomonadota bacterium]
MSHVFPRSNLKEPPVAMRGEGVYLYDAQGKQYLDGSCGAAVSCLGHGDRDVINAVKDQMDQLAYAHTRFFTSQPAEALARLLIENAPTGIERVYFVSGGSEAVEAALKLARQYFLEIGQPERSKIIARKQSYHGNTLGALAAGGNEWRRAQFAPLLVDVSHISPCYEYRGRDADETPEAYGERMAAELEFEIERLGSETVLAFVAEPVVGATLGAVPAVPGYFKKVREICDRHGVLLILDEVMCGMGRTGHLFSCEYDGVRPDIVTIAKGLGGGYQPIGAMLCSGIIYNALTEGSGFFQHGHTYLGHPAAAAAGRAVLQKLLNEGLVERSKDMGERLQVSLRDALGQHAHVGDIRGRGLFVGVELVSDRETKEPFDPSLRINKKIENEAIDRGLICYPMGGTIDGKTGDHVLLAPPFIISDDEIGELTEKLAGAINATV